MTGNPDNGLGKGRAYDHHSSCHCSRARRMSRRVYYVWEYIYNIQGPPGVILCSLGQRAIILWASETRKIMYEVASPITLFVFSLSLFFFILHPSNRNRIRVLQTTLLGCKRVCHVTSASIWVPSARPLSLIHFICHPLSTSIFFFSFYSRFRFLYCNIYIYILCVCVRITQIVLL